MLKRISRLFVIKTRFEALLVIYALAVGASERGLQYLHEYPGIGGYALFAACFGAVFMAGAKILDGVPVRPKKRTGERRRADRRSGDRRQESPARPA